METNLKQSELYTHFYVCLFKLGHVCSTSQEQITFKKKTIASSFPLDQTEQIDTSNADRGN